LVYCFKSIIEEFIFLDFGLYDYYLMDKELNAVLDLSVATILSFSLLSSLSKLLIELRIDNAYSFF